MKIRTVSVDTMRKSDAYTIANKVSSKELMRRAGEGIFLTADWKAPAAVVCGKGNNAGDGFVVAKLLHDHGISCDLVLLSDEFSEDGKYYFDKCRDAGIRTVRWDPQSDSELLRSYASILDCIFGTGFSGTPREPYRSAIEAINASGAYVVSADINSGLNGDTGLGESFVISDLTVSIGDFKTGHFSGLSDKAIGKIVNVDIGIEII